MRVETKNTDDIRSISSIEDLYRLYHRKLIHFFTAKGLEWEVAEDLSQEVFFRFLRCNKTIEGKDHARNLLYRIAHNLAIDYFRKHNGSVRERALSPDGLTEEQPYMVAEEDGPEDRLISNETSQDIRSAVARLPLRYAQAIMLKEYDGLSYREIAEHMGVSQKAVESLLYRAKSQLKEDLVESGRKRGGWWSGILLGLHGFRERAALKPLQALGRIGWKWQGMSLGLGSVGVGKGLLNLVAVILLVGSVVGTGAAATVSACREAPATERGAEAPPAPVSSENTAEVMATEDATDGPALDKGRTEEGEHAPAPAAEAEPAPESGMLAGPGVLLTRAGDALRETITTAGSGLDLILADLGQLVSALTEPLAGLLSCIGVPQRLLGVIADLASLEPVRDLTAGLVQGVADATQVLDGVAGLLPSLPPALPGGTAQPAESDEDEVGERSVAPGVTPTDGADATPTPTPTPVLSAPAPVEQGDAADHQEDDTGGEEAEETTTVGGIVTDLLDTVIVVVGNLLPF